MNIKSGTALLHSVSVYVAQEFINSTRHTWRLVDFMKVGMTAFRPEI